MMPVAGAAAAVSDNLAENRTAESTIQVKCRAAQAFYAVNPELPIWVLVKSGDLTPFGERQLTAAERNCLRQSSALRGTPDPGGWCQKVAEVP